jgi:hypothetical protein
VTVRQRRELRRDITSIAIPTIVMVIGVLLRIRVGQQLTPPEPLWWCWLLVNGTTWASIGVACTLVYVRRKYGPLGSSHANHQ